MYIVNVIVSVYTTVLIIIGMYNKSFDVWQRVHVLPDSMHQINNTQYSQ